MNYVCCTTTFVNFFFCASNRKKWDWNEIGADGRWRAVIAPCCGLRPSAGGAAAAVQSVLRRRSGRVSQHYHRTLQWLAKLWPLAPTRKGFVSDLWLVVEDERGTGTVRLVQLVGAERAELLGSVGLHCRAGVPARNRRLVSQGCVSGARQRCRRPRRCARQAIRNAKNKTK